MVAWHHQLNGHEFEKAPGVGDNWTGKPGVLAVHGVAESDMTERLNGMELMGHFFHVSSGQSSCLA